MLSVSRWGNCHLVSGWWINGIVLLDVINVYMCSILNWLTCLDSSNVDHFDLIQTQGILMYRNELIWHLRSGNIGKVVLPEYTDSDWIEGRLTPSDEFGLIDNRNRINSSHQIESVHKWLCVSTESACFDSNLRCKHSEQRKRAMARLLTTNAYRYRRI